MDDILPADEAPVAEVTNVESVPAVPAASPAPLALGWALKPKA